MRAWGQGAFAALALILTTACTPGPDYVRPTAAIPAQWKEAGDWKPAAEGSTPVAATRWWEAYGDPALNELVARVNIDNQNIRAAEAQFRQAMAALALAASGQAPTLAASASATRSRSGEASAATSDRLALNASWEVDLWGRIGRGVEAGQAAMEASAADLESARLSARSALVQAYFQLRANDVQRQLLARTTVAYERSLEITRNRYAAGVAGRGDVAQAETQLRSTQAQAIDLGISRAELEHAIATLSGRPPAELALPPQATLPALPAIPPRLPSQLLERRPDIVAAERRVAAANAQIGIAQAAYFPVLTLGASLGHQGSSFAHLLSLPNRFWSFGPALALTLFDGGARAARTDDATASWERSVATYRQTVLTAFQEVEDKLATLRILDQESAVQQAAARAAAEALTLANDQYLAGTVSYLNVVSAQAAALAAERGSVEIAGRRLQASVALAKALGGDWQASASGKAVER